jgi:hypothetical protein
MILIDDIKLTEFSYFHSSKKTRFSDLIFDGVSQIEFIKSELMNLGHECFLISESQEKAFRSDHYLVLKSYIYIKDFKRFFNFVVNIIDFKKPSIFTHNNIVLGGYFTSKDSLSEYFNQDCLNIDDLKFNEIFEVIKPDFMAEIYSMDSLREVLTSKLSSRQFNQIESRADSIKKISTNVKKIKAEFNYYSSLPEIMQRYFLRPYLFNENGKIASYHTEKISFPDMSFFWVQGLLDAHSFEVFLDKIFEFIDVRFERKSVYGLEFDLRKMDDRYSEFSSKSDNLDLLDEFNKIAKKDFKSLIKELKSNLLKFKSQFKNEAISHGDLCLSNIFYVHKIGLLKFIDPRGINELQDYFLPAMYDIIKLSHSILGDYDHIVKGNYDLRIDSNLNYELMIPNVNIELKESFINRLKSRGYNLRELRLYEVSLFWSMLPLHDDDKKKTLALFIKGLEIFNEYK